MVSSSPPSEFTIRPAEPADARSMGALWAHAFPGERTAEDRAQALRDGTDTFGGLDTCFVGEIGGRPAGAFRAYRLTTYLFGRPIPTLGLAAVAVSPEFRRRGVGRALCLEALCLGRARGDLLSILYPFRVDYYHRLGWSLEGSFHRYRFAPGDLPLFPGRERVRILEIGDRRPRIPELYDTLLPHRHGLLQRGPRQWKALDDPELLVLGVESDSGEASSGSPALSGAALFESRTARRGHGPELRLREMHVTDPAAYRALLGWLSAQRDQWHMITYDALPGEQLEQVLAHPRVPETGARRGLWFASATVLRGPMVRIVNIERLAAELGAEPGTRLDLRDEEIPEQQGAWEADETGTLRRLSADPGGGGLPVALASGLLARGALPGIGTVRADFDPVMGISDFHLLDSF